jgi:pre-mRNA-splicing factor SYF1
MQLWHAYLSERRSAVRGLAPNHPALTALAHTYERALVTMHKMPRIWLDYLQLLMDMKKVTQVSMIAV